MVYYYYYYTIPSTTCNGLTLARPLPGHGLALPSCSPALEKPHPNPTRPCLAPALPGQNWSV